MTEENVKQELHLVYAPEIKVVDVVPVVSGRDSSNNAIVAREQDCALIGFADGPGFPLTLYDVGKAVSEQVPVAGPTDGAPNYEFRFRIVGLGIKAGPVGEVSVSSGTCIKLSPENVGAGVFDSIARAHAAFVDRRSLDDRVEEKTDVVSGQDNLAALRQLEELIKAGVSMETFHRAQNGDPSARKEIDAALSRRVTLQ